MAGSLLVRLGVASGPNEVAIEVVGDMAEVVDVDPIWDGADEDEIDKDKVNGDGVGEVDGDEDDVDVTYLIWQCEVHGRHQLSREFSKGPNNSTVVADRFVW